MIDDLQRVRADEIGVKNLRCVLQAIRASIAIRGRHSGDGNADPYCMEGSLRRRVRTVKATQNLKSFRSRIDADYQDLF